MTQSPENNLFSSADIERYHSGQMPAEERHALEKAALDDPFLADALEGYAYTTTASEDLLRLKARLQEKTGSKKIVPFFIKNRIWMRVAAVLLVVAGGVWLLNKTTLNKNNSVALEIKKPLQELNKTETTQTPDNNLKSDKTTTNAGMTSDSTTHNSFHYSDSFALADVNQKPSRYKLKFTTDSTSNATIMSPVGVTANPINKETNSETKEVNEAPSTAYKTDDRRNRGALEFKTNNQIITRNRGIDGSNRALPDVTNNGLYNRQATSNDIRSRNSVDTVTHHFDLADKEKDSKVDTIRNVNIVLTPQQSMLEEVVVSKGLNKKTTEMKGRTQGFVIDTLEPAEGWTNFDEYVAGNLKMPEELKQKPINTGEVELSFEVNQLGEPVNIKVEKSLCAKCDEEAIRLLREGPKWKKKKKTKTGKVTIRF